MSIRSALTAFLFFFPLVRRLSTPVPPFEPAALGSGGGGSVEVRCVMMAPSGFDWKAGCCSTAWTRWDSEDKICCRDLAVVPLPNLVASRACLAWTYSTQPS